MLSCGGGGDSGGGADDRIGGVICDAGAPNRIGVCPEFIGADFEVPDGTDGAGPDGKFPDAARAGVVVSSTIREASRERIASAYQIVMCPF